MNTQASEVENEVLETGATDNATNAETSAELPAIETRFYGPDELTDAAEAIASAVAIAQSQNRPIVQNFTDDTEIPEGYGIAIRPVNKRGIGLLGLIVAMVPTVETFANDENGADFIQTTIQNAVMDKLAGCVRGRGDDHTFAGQLPFTVQQFMESGGRGDGSLAAFRAVASAFVKVLKSKGASKMTNTLLRAVCESKAMAEAEFPTIPQTQWENIIRLMEKKAAAKGESTRIFQHWLATRDQVEIVESSELDFGDLAGLV